MNSLCDEYVWGGEKFQPVVRLKADLSPNKCVNQELQNEFTKWCTLQEWVKLRAAVMQLKGRRPSWAVSKKNQNNTLPFPTALRDSTSNLSTFRTCTGFRHSKGSLSSCTTYVMQSDGEGMCRGGDGGVKKGMAKSSWSVNPADHAR